MDATSLKFYMDKFPFREIADDKGGESSQFVTCPVRLAFAHLDEPRAKRSGTKVYSLTAIIPNGADLSVPKAIAARVAGAANPNWKKLYDVQSFNMPIRSSAKRAMKGYAGFEADGFDFEAQTTFAPAIVDRNMRPLDPKAPGAVYSGMWALVRCRTFFYPAKEGNAGVSFGLSSIQKIADDEEFKGGDATDAFGAIVEHAPGEKPAAAANGSPPVGAAALSNW